MSPKKILALIILLLPVLGACFSSSLVFEEENFPLTQTDNLSAGETIYHLGTSDSALVFDTLNSVQGIDVDKHAVDWKVDGFSANVDSEILFSDNYAVLMSHDAILLIDNQGQKTFLNLNERRRGNIDLAAVHGNYIYVIRGGFWDLEVYDIATNKMLWETSTGRGGTSIYYESSIDTAYVINSSSIRAFNNSIGELLWEYEIEVDQSSYANGVLYLVEDDSDSKKYSINAFDVVARKIIWYEEFNYNLEIYVNGLSIFQDVLVLSTRYNFIAFDIANGKPKWQSSVEDIFYTKPVLLGDVLYVKGVSKKVYAISFIDGATVGFVQLESDSNFLFTPSYEADSGVYLFQDVIALKTEDGIVFYGPK